MDAETILSIWRRFVYLAIGVFCFLLLAPLLLWPMNHYRKLQDRHDSQAKNDAMQVRQAVETYFTEYHRFPIVDHFIETPSQPFLSDHELMDVLFGSDRTAAPDGLNPRRIAFYGGRKAKGNPPKSGVVNDVGGSGELFDPWGNHYRILMDLTGDGQLAHPPWSTKRRSGSAETIPQSVIVWSPGPDGDDETEGDNITTW